MTIDDVPREALVEMLKERAYRCIGGPMFDGREGYSMCIDSETAIRDIVYRDAPLFATQEEAIVNCWQQHYRECPASSSSRSGINVIRK